MLWRHVYSAITFVGTDHGRFVFAIANYDSLRDTDQILQYSEKEPTIAKVPSPSCDTTISAQGPIFTKQLDEYCKLAIIALRISWLLVLDDCKCEARPASIGHSGKKIVIKQKF